jgi:hypothetical protein
MVLIIYYLISINLPPEYDLFKLNIDFDVQVKIGFRVLTRTSCARPVTNNLSDPWREL